MRRGFFVVGSLAVLAAGLLWAGSAAAVAPGGPDLPNDGIWNQINVDSPVTYTPPGKTAPETFEPWAGTRNGEQFHFFAKEGTVNKLVVFYQGGGACWDFNTCGGSLGIALCKTTLTTLSEINDKLKDFLDPPVGTEYTSVMDGSTKTYPTSPFNSWYMVFVPYATCDAHTGNNIVTYAGSFGRKLKVYHKGAANSLAVIKWIDDNFVSPDEIFIAGSSAGSIGAITSTPYYMELFPGSQITVLGDAGIFRITSYFEKNALPNWKLDLMWPTFIPSLASGPTLLYNDTIKGFAGMWESIVPHYSTRKFAEYSDSSDDVQEYFNYRIHRYDPNDKITQDAAATDWQQDMLSYTSAMSTNKPNYKYYIAPGSDHVVLNNNPKIFSLEVANSLEANKIVKFITFLTDELSPDLTKPASSVISSGSHSVFSITPSIVQEDTDTEVAIAGSGFVNPVTVTFEGEEGPKPTVVVTGVTDANGDGTLDTISAVVTTKKGGPPRDLIWDVLVTQSSPDEHSSVLPEGFVVDKEGD